MQLLSASRVSQEDLLYITKTVRAVKIYYAFNGRNAWWSTWITRYADGCMHGAWDSVKSFCEKHRVQGTVFYINELPAVAFCAGNRALVISEINTTKILSQLNFKLLSGLTTLLPLSTLTLEQLTHIFDSYSSFWPKSFPRKNSVFQVYCNDANNLLSLSTKDLLLHNTSSSVGPKYYLKWSEKDSKIERKIIIDLVKSLNDKLK